MRSLRFSDEHRTGPDEVVTVESIELTTEILCKQKSACYDSELNFPRHHVIELSLSDGLELILILNGLTEIRAVL